MGNFYLNFFLGVFVVDYSSKLSSSTLLAISLRLNPVLFIVDSFLSFLFSHSRTSKIQEETFVAGTILVGLVGFEPATFARRQGCACSYGFLRAPELLHPTFWSANPLSAFWSP